MTDARTIEQRLNEVCPDDLELAITTDGRLVVLGTCDTPEKFAFLCGFMDRATRDVT